VYNKAVKHRTLPSMCSKLVPPMHAIRHAGSHYDVTDMLC